MEGRLASSWRSRVTSTASTPMPINPVPSIGSVPVSTIRGWPSLDGDDFGQGARTVDVETVESGHRVGEQLQGHHIHDGGKQLMGSGDPQNLSLIHISEPTRQAE